ncbi:predicted protein [Arabidopsis lyrata subsp. lyrata]|uniref:Predicted protein n=1 Tax=Arabidopsis lyrata subsp. lyrata TaxID=81972 RepID=D7LMC1_ARALL|nr:predicted protein [Arabidopsis lyrata subsp. lyrata]
MGRNRLTVLQNIDDIESKTVNAAAWIGNGHTLACLGNLDIGTSMGCSGKCRVAFLLPSTLWSRHPTSRAEHLTLDLLVGKYNPEKLLEYVIHRKSGGLAIHLVVADVFKVDKKRKKHSKVELSLGYKNKAGVTEQNHNKKEQTQSNSKDLYTLKEGEIKNADHSIQLGRKPPHRSSEHRRSRIKDRKRGCLDWERPHFGVSGQSRHRDIDGMLGRRQSRLSVGLNSLASSLD